MLNLCGDVAAMSCSYTLLLLLGIGFYFSVHPDSVIEDILLIVPLPDSLLFRPSSPYFSFWYDTSIIDPHILTCSDTLFLTQIVVAKQRAKPECGIV
jgi:hypothetical protein